jgi:uncharacterized membrane protein
MRRTGIILLAISLTLNAFFLGLGGALFTRLHKGALAEMEFFLARRLPAADMPIFNADLAAGRPGYIAALVPVIAAHEKFDATLRATPFDPAASRAALDAWRAAFNNFLQTFETPLLNAVTDISPAGRHALAAQGDATAGRANGFIAGQ